MRVNLPCLYGLACSAMSAIHGRGWNEAIARAIETNHVSTQANTYQHMAFFEIVRGDCDAARRAAQAVVELAEEHGLAQYAMWGALSTLIYAPRSRTVSPGLRKLVQALEAYSGQGYKNTVPLYQGLLAELEAEGQSAQAALARIDEALALASRTGEHWRTPSCTASAARFY